MNQPSHLYIDGHPSGESWTQDRAFLYGDGLFETMLVRNGRIRFEALHRARLAQGCERLAIAADQPAIWRHAGALARRHGAALLRLQLSRGISTARGYAPSGEEQPQWIAGVYPAPGALPAPAPIRVVTSRHVLGENPALAGLKHCNRLEQVLARAALAGTDAFEALMASSSGLLVSGTMSNLFAEVDGALMTPELDLCGVAGVMRAVVLREARRAGVPLLVKRMPIAALAGCTSIALSNARLGLLSAHELDGRALRASMQLQDLAARIEQLDD